MAQESEQSQAVASRRSGWRRWSRRKTLFAGIATGLVGAVGAAAVMVLGSTAATATVELRLPFPAGQSYPVTQPPGGSFSHTDAYNQHAIDIGLPAGTPVLAAGDGTVSFEGWDPNNLAGIMALVDHGDGLCSLYAHLNSTIINTGQQVTQGQQIGTSGTTSSPTTSVGAHLHWDMVSCDMSNPLSLATPNTVEYGTSYPQDAALTSQNGL